jgi:hypothetical protein
MVIEAHGASERAFGLLRFRGADVRKFLQGQLSNDMAALSAERVLLAGLHNPQGRVLALLRLLAPDPEQVVALLPAELAEPTMIILRRYVLRAKLTIAQEPGAAALNLPAFAALMAPGAHAQEIAAGMPQVYGATSGQFVAQMLNLDAVGAISFSKGCYTGQEIIARAHYLGRIKRRMQRFLTGGAVALAPAQAVTLSDGRAAQVVDSVQRDDGRSEFLAVAPLPKDTAAGPSGAQSADGSGALKVEALPLPYALSS